MRQISEKAKKLLENLLTKYAGHVLERGSSDEYATSYSDLSDYIDDLEAENRALRHSLELRECEEMEHKPDPLEGVQFVSLSNAEIAAMTPEHPLYKLVKGDRKCKDE